VIPILEVRFPAGAEYNYDYKNIFMTNTNLTLANYGLIELNNNEAESIEGGNIWFRTLPLIYEAAKAAEIAWNGLVDGWNGTYNPPK
jgi:hypothetical protein